MRGWGKSCSALGNTFGARRGGGKEVPVLQRLSSVSGLVAGLSVDVT
jgi:hypothetical protein